MHNHYMTNRTLQFKTATIALCIFSTMLLTACIGGDKPHKAQLHAKGGVNTASLSQDGRYSLVASVNHQMGLWDNSKQSLKYTWKHGRSSGADIVAVAINPKGTKALTAERDNVVLWDIKTGKGLQFWSMPQQIIAVALSANERYALIGFRSGDAEYIDLENGQTVRRFPHTDRVNTVSLSNDGKYALTGGNDKVAKLWDIKSGKLLFTWPHKKRVKAVVISPKNNYALTAASQDSVKLWDLRTGQLIRKLNFSPMTVSAARFSPSEKYIAVGSIPQTLNVWDVRTGEHVIERTLPKASYWKPTSTIIYAVGFTPDEKGVNTEDSRGYRYQWKMN